MPNRYSSKIHNKIIQLLKNGTCPKDVRIKFPQVSSGHISTLRKRAMIKPFKQGRKLGPLEKTKSRMAEAIKMMENGLSITRIAAHFNVTRQCIHQQLEPEKHKARHTVRRSLRYGKINRPLRCENCLNKSYFIEAHHSDYLKPLSVEWLCRNCHGLNRKIFVAKNKLQHYQALYAQAKTKPLNEQPCN